MRCGAQTQAIAPGVALARPSLHLSVRVFMPDTGTLLESLSSSPSSFPVAGQWRRLGDSPTLDQPLFLLFGYFSLQLGRNGGGNFRRLARWRRAALFPVWLHHHLAGQATPFSRKSSPVFIGALWAKKRRVCLMRQRMTIHTTSRPRPDSRDIVLPAHRTFRQDATLHIGRNLVARWNR